VPCSHVGHRESLRGAKGSGDLAGIIESAHRDVFQCKRFKDLLSAKLDRVLLVRQQGRGLGQIPCGHVGIGEGPRSALMDKVHRFMCFFLIPVRQHGRGLRLLPRVEICLGKSLSSDQATFRVLQAVHEKLDRNGHKRGRHLHAAPLRASLLDLHAPLLLACHDTH